MKVIHTAALKKKSQIMDFIIEKAKGLYDKIRNVFRGDEETMQEAIDTEREEEERQEQESFEKLFGQQEITGVLEDQSLPNETIQPEFMATYEPEQTKAAESLGEDIEIGYRTFYDGILIPRRKIRPLYTKYADTTGNYILVSWDYDMNDFRAYVIPNILPVVEGT